jgi:hypothetical protein
MIDKCNLGIGEGTLAKRLPNLWLGVHVANQQEASERISSLLRIPAAVRWLSFNPRGMINLSKWLQSDCTTCIGSGENPECPGNHCPECYGYKTENAGINWITCEGESGPHARPMHPDWVRSIRDDCVAEGVPFFFKGWGEWLPYCQLGETADNRVFAYQTVDSSKCFVMTQDGRNHGSPWSGWKSDMADGVAMLRLGKTSSGRLLEGRTRTPGTAH